MNLRVFLKISTAGLILAGISVSIHPFISAMGISEDAKNNDLAVIDLPELKPGELVRIEIAKNRVREQYSLILASIVLWPGLSFKLAPSGSCGRRFGGAPYVRG